MKRFIYLARSCDNNETLAFESEDDAQALVEKGHFRGPLTVEFFESDPAKRMAEIGATIAVEEPQSGGSVRV